MEAEMIGELDFNRDDDREEFGCSRVVVDVARTEDVIALTFLLGRKEDNTITVLFKTSEFLLKLGKIL